MSPTTPPMPETARPMAAPPPAIAPATSGACTPRYGAPPASRLKLNGISAMLLCPRLHAPALRLLRGRLALRRTLRGHCPGLRHLSSSGYQCCVTLLFVRLGLGLA